MRDVDGGILSAFHTADWGGRFRYSKETGRWRFYFIDERDNDTELFGEGETHKDAFESLVQRWTILNGGESKNLHNILPLLRQAFNDEGELIVPAEIEQ